MPPEAAQTAAEPEAKPIPTAEASENAAKGTESKKPENFREAMRRLGGDNVFDGPVTEESALEEEAEASGTGGGEPEPETASGEPKPKPAKKAKSSEVQVSPDAKEAEFKAWAEKQGLIFENGRVTTAERAKFREERRTHSEALKSAEANALAKIDEARKTFESELTEARSIKEAKASGDANALAKAIGFEDWNKAQEHFLSHQADPNYKKLLELEEWKKTTEAQREQEAKQRAEQEQRQAQLQAQQQYRQQLSGQMKGSKDPLIAAMAEDPLFVGAIFNIQSAHYDGSSTVTPEQAIKLAQQGGRSLFDEMRQLYERLGKAFGVASAPETPVAPPVAKKTAPKSPPVPPTPRPSTLNRRQSDREFLDYARGRMNEAWIEEDRAARQGRRT